MLSSTERQYMDEDKKQDSEIIVTPEVIAETEEIVKGEEQKVARSIKDTGRKSVMEKPELLREYIRIYQLRVVGHYLPVQIVEQFAKEGKEISESKVDYACNWCRSKWQILSTKEYLVDAENMLSARIREYTTMIEKAKKGEAIFMLNGLPLLDKEGNQMIRIDKEGLRSLMRDRSVIERTLLDIRGLSIRAQTIIANTAVIGDAHIEMHKKLSLFEVMEEPDKQRYLEIFDKYGKPPRAS